MKKRGGNLPTINAELFSNTALQNSQNDREIPAFAGMEKGAGMEKRSGNEKKGAGISRQSMPNCFPTPHPKTVRMTGRFPLSREWECWL